jgi:hypothetical protein
MSVDFPACHFRFYAFYFPFGIEERYKRGGIGLHLMAINYSFIFKTMKRQCNGFTPRLVMAFGAAGMFTAQTPYRPPIRSCSKTGASFFATAMR